jgi:hypothetical protein
VTTLPTDSKGRKDIPITRGALDYFPAALAEVAKLSKAGAKKHCNGELYHNRGASTDHADCIVRHLMERGTIDPEDGLLHDVKVVWRALAMLQEELERRGAPLARGAKKPSAIAELQTRAAYVIKANPRVLPVGTKVRIIKSTTTPNTGGREGVVSVYREGWDHPYLIAMDSGEQFPYALEELEELVDQQVVLQELRAATAQILSDVEKASCESYMVPVIHSIKDIPEEQFAPNSIHERIAGDTPLARKIKNQYYGGTAFMVGTPVHLKDGAHHRYVGKIVVAPDADGWVQVRWMQAIVSEHISELEIL